MRQPDLVEAGGTRSENIDPRQNRRDRSLLNILQGSSGQDSKGETLPGGSGVGGL